MADTSDYIRGGAFILLFLLTGLRDLNTWLLADLIFTGFTGFLLYLNPAWTITLQVKTAVCLKILWFLNFFVDMRVFFYDFFKNMGSLILILLGNYSCTFL
jgi:hypothetical protein